MNSLLAGDLSRRLAAIKFSYYRYLEFSVVARATSFFFIYIPPRIDVGLTHCLLGGFTPDIVKKA
jgi:hypothetical protein